MTDLKANGFPRWWQLKYVLKIFTTKIGEDEPIFDSQILKTWVGSTTN